MEEEIDLRPYLEALFKRWYWIVAVALTAGVLAFAISSLLPPTYEATALIVVTSPQQVVLHSLTQDTLDPNFSSVDETMPLLRAYPELATSDEIIRQLWNELDLPGSEIEGIEDLRRRLTAEAGSDPSLLRLTAQYKDAQTAAHMANTWAALFVPWVNDAYGVTNSEQLRFFEMQLAGVFNTLETAETELITFQATNRATVLENHLNALTEALANLLEEQQILSSLLQDAQQLRTQLTTQGVSDSVSFAYQLTALNLQLRTYNAEIPSGIQLQLAPEGSLTGNSRDEHLRFVDSLLSSLTERQIRIEEDLSTIEPQILNSQQELQVAVTEEQRLQRSLEEAEETYRAMVRRVEVERISTDDTIGGVSLASSSSVPNKPTSTSSLILAAAASSIAGILGILGILLQFWWASQTSSSFLAPARSNVND